MARSTSPNLVVPDAPGQHVRGASARPLIVNLILSLRPGQWTKNLLVFAALIFAVKLFDPHSLVLSCAAFALFCALSGVVYVVNDIADRETDRLHPLKSLRPIA